MKRISNLLVGLAAVLVCTSCDDIFEEDISDDIITIITPTQDEVISGNTVTFMWNGLEGADNYRVQVSRSNTSEMTLDSLVGKTSLSVPFPSGEFEWRVRGENFAYTTSYTFPEGFLVESSNDLSVQNVFLSTPSDNFYTRNNTIILNWSVLEAAESNSLQVTKTIGGNSSVTLQQDELVSTSFTLDANTLDGDAAFKWSVKGVNETSETPFSNRTILLDTQVPNQPSLISPNDAETVGTIVDFSWGSPEDIGAVQSPLQSLLEIATEEDFSAILQTYTVAGGSGERQHEFSNPGEYFWRVRMEDQAGNIGQYSVVKTITVE